MGGMELGILEAQEWLADPASGQGRTDTWIGC